MLLGGLEFEGGIQNPANTISIPIARQRAQALGLKRAPAHFSERRVPPLEHV